MRKIKNKTSPFLINNKGFDEFRETVLDQSDADYEYIKQELNKYLATIRGGQSYVVLNMKLQSIQQNLDKYIADHDVVIYSLNKWIKDMRNLYPKGSPTSQLHESFLSPVQFSIQFIESVFDVFKDMEYTFIKGLPVNCFIEYLKAMTDHLRSDFTSLRFIQDELLIRWYISTMSYINDVDINIRQWAKDNSEMIGESTEHLPSAIWMNILADKIILNPRDLKQLMTLHSMIYLLYFVYVDKKEKPKEEK